MEPSITVLAIDDADIDFSKLTLPLGYAWHPASTRRLKMLNAPAVAHHDLYERLLDVLRGADLPRNADAWPGLRGTAILILDLNLQIEQFPHQQYLEECFGNDRTRVWATELQGFHAATEALRNPDWRGMIALTSTVLTSRVGAELLSVYRQAVAQLLQQRPADREVVIEKIDNAINVDPRLTTHVPQTVLNDIIRVFKIRFPDAEIPSLDRRLWPKEPADWWLRNHEGFGDHEWMNSTESWFGDGTPAHDWADTKNRPAGLESVKAYLWNLLTFEPPHHWFEPPEVEVLWEELKRLLGSCASADAGGDRAVSLGGMYLVTAAAFGSYSRSSAEIHHWRRKTPSVVPPQERLVAKDAILAWAKLFEKLRVHKDDVSRPLLRRLELQFGPAANQGGRLQVELALDSTKPNGDRPSLLECFRALSDDGKVSSHLTQFIARAACARDGSREACAALNLISRQAADSALSIFELVPVHANLETPSTTL